MASPLPQQSIEHPATAHVRPWPAQVGEDVGVVATCFFEGVGQHRQTVEGSAIVDALG